LGYEFRLLDVEEKYNFFSVKRASAVNLARGSRRGAMKTKRKTVRGD
jgi:hypothetical protein